VEVTKDTSRVYSFLYAEFVVPLVKAVPEIATKYHEKIKDDETTINEIVGIQNQIDESKALVINK